jgi:hypothetical protein
MHVLGQVIPAGLLVTDPVPVPASITVNAKFTALNVTVTATALVITFVQGSVVPKHPPPVQFAKLEPTAAVAVKFTIAPLGKLKLQAPLPVATCPSANVQLIPVGLLVIVPVPFPVLPDTTAGERDSANVPGPLLNVAVTVVFAVSVTLHVFAVPVQPPPLHPPNTDPEPGVSDILTTVPLGKVAEHVPTVTPVVSLQVKFEEAPYDTPPYAVPLSETVSVRFVVGTNVAVTDSAASISRVQVPAPAQAPLQPENAEPDPAVAVSVTCVPVLKFAEHVLGQVIPLGTLATDPLPAPAIVTVSGNVVRANVAVTVSAELIVTTQLPVPLHAPLHPVNVEPLAGVSASVTTVPLAKSAVHVCVQLIPAGLLTTVPVPVPAATYVNSKLTAVLKFAVTACAALIVTVQVPVPVQFPLQPVKVDPPVAVAVSTTCVPTAKLSVQTAGHVIPAGVLATLPVPVPAMLTVRSSPPVPGEPNTAMPPSPIIPPKLF